MTGNHVSLPPGPRAGIVAGLRAGDTAAATGAPVADCPYDPPALPLTYAAWVAGPEAVHPRPRRRPRRSLPTV